MASDFEQALRTYADLAVKVALNIQPGQRLLIGDPFFNVGVPLETAPLVRLIAASAYEAGARFVDVMWGDDQLHLVRLKHAARDSFEEYPQWHAQGMLDYAKAGDSILVILANNPDLFNDQDPTLVATIQRMAWQQIHPMLDYVMRNAINSAVIAAAVPGWAAKVFPDLPPDAQTGRLWDAIFEVCRVNQPDPIAAWQDHLKALEARSAYLNAKQYSALTFSAPGTALTVGLPKRHAWKSSHRTSEAGIPFTANVPTEEIFTLPHKDRVEGVVTVTKPMSFGGTVIENVRLSFAEGRVASIHADKGEAVLRQLIETDEGAGMLGEVALVPHSSPVSQSGLLFYNILIDENAANHIALGRAYRFNLQGGEGISDEEFAAAGGNHSLIHFDCMIGSAEMDVDGLTDDGRTEPVMRRGEWAFEV